MAATDNRPRRAAPAPRRSVLPPPVEGAIVDLRSVTKRYSKVDVGVEEAASFAFGGCSIFIVRGTWKASTPSRITPPTPAMIFCRLALALGSNFFAIV